MSIDIEQSAHAIYRDAFAPHSKDDRFYDSKIFDLIQQRITGLLLQPIYGDAVSTLSSEDFRQKTQSEIQYSDQFQPSGDYTGVGSSVADTLITDAENRIQNVIAPLVGQVLDR